MIMLLLTVLALAVWFDFRERRIPNALLLPVLTVALLAHISLSGAGGLLFSLAGLAVGLALLMPFYVSGGMGAGDIKLLGVVGSILGPWQVVLTGAFTLVMGALMGAAVVSWRLLMRRHSGLAGDAWTYEKNELSRAELLADAPLPYALAIAAGALIVCGRDALFSPLLQAWYALWTG